MDMGLVLPQVVHTELEVFFGDKMLVLVSASRLHVRMSVSVSG